MKTSETESILLQKINIIASSLSMFSGIWVWFLYWFFKEIRLFLYELIMWLSITRVISDATAFIPINSSQTLCSVQALVYSYSHFQSWIALTSLSYFFYLYCIKTGYVEHHKKRFRILFLTFSLVIISPCILFMSQRNVIENSGMFCWIGDPRERNDNKYQALLGYCLWIAFFIAINIYWIFKVNLMLSRNATSWVKERKIYKVLQLYPISRILGSIPLIIGICFKLELKEECFTLKLWKTITSTLFTTVLGILYIHLPHVKISLKSMYSRMKGNGDDEIDSERDSLRLKVMDNGNVKGNVNGNELKK